MTDLICSFDSRNRKKEHVEALEREIKRYVERNHELEDENKTLQMHLNNSMMQNEELLLHNDQLSREIEALKAEQNHLMVQQSDSSAATLPAQNSDEFSQWVMDINGWGKLLMIDGFDMDPDQRLASSVV
jgi:cell division protein FtsB